MEKPKGEIKPMIEENKIEKENEEKEISPKKEAIYTFITDIKYLN